MKNTQIPFFDLTRQYAQIQKEVEPAVCAQLASCGYIGGKAVSEFEADFAAFCGVRHAVACNSGTDALAISLRAAGVKSGDEVITTPFTFFATAEMIASVGAVPVFADVDESTYNLDPAKIEEKITEKTVAVLPVHIFGRCADMDPIKAVAKRHGLKVIEDSCQAVGAEYKGKKAGSLGDAGCFSFYPTKNLGGIGDGGIITTNDDGIATVCRALREHGMAQNGARARALLSGEKDELAGTVAPDGLYNPYKYYNYLIAYNSRLDAVQAVVLNLKLKHLADFNARRRAIAAYYADALAGCGALILPPPDPGCVWHQYVLRAPDKEGLIAALGKKGVGCGNFYPVPLHLQKAFDYLGYKEGDLPAAEALCRQTVCLPVWPELTDGETAYIADSIKEIYKR